MVFTVMLAGKLTSKLTVTTKRCFWIQKYMLLKIKLVKLDLWFQNR